MRTTFALAALLILAACDSVIYGRDQSGNINYPSGYQPPDPATQMLILSTMRNNQPQWPAYQAPPATTPANCTSYRVGNTVQTNCY